MLFLIVNRFEEVWSHADVKITQFVKFELQKQNATENFPLDQRRSIVIFTT